MKKFLKLTFALMALMFGMVACSDDDEPAKDDVIPNLPGTVPAPEFTGIDETARANFAKGYIDATLVSGQWYQRVQIAGSTPEKPRYVWRETNGESVMYLKDGKIYVKFLPYAHVYMEENPDALGAIIDLDFYWRTSYRGTGTFFPTLFCASEFDFDKLPDTRLQCRDIEVVELNDKRLAYSIANLKESDITTFCVFGISRGIDPEGKIMVNSVEDGCRLMLDRCYDVLCVSDEGYRPFIDEIAETLGLK